MTVSLYTLALFNLVLLKHNFTVKSFTRCFLFFLFMEDEKITISPNEVHVKIYNNIRCNVNISNNLIGNFVVEPLDTFRIDYSLAVNETELSIDLDPMCQINSGTMKYNISTSNAGQVKFIS